MGDERGRSASIDRHFLLVHDLLRGRSHDRRSLAARLGVQPAMADRLLKAALTLPGVREVREGRRRSILFDPQTLMPSPTYPTAVAACFGASLWPLFRGSSYERGLRDALAQVTGRTRRRAVFKDIDRKFWFLRRGGEAGLLEHAALLDDALEAVLHHKVVVAEYTRFDGHVERLRLEPLSVAVHDHQLYVVARGEGGRLHPYRFARFASIDVQDETFRYPTRAEYDPERVFKASFGVFLDRPAAEVVLRLDPRWATYAKTHRWHDTQTVEVGRDHVRISLRVGLCPELEAWILGFGEQAAVVAPRELAERVRARRLAAARGSAREPRERA